MRLRQVALIARDLDPVVSDLCEALGVEVCFRDPGVGEFGLHNALMAIGDTFLEVVSPLRADTAGGRFLERHGGDWGYMVILQCDDLDADRARLQRLGVRVVWQADLADIRGTHLHPRDVGGAILSLDAAMPPESWRWGGPDWSRHVRRDVVREIVGVDIQAADPRAVAARWAEVLDQPLREVAAERFEVPLERGTIGFVPAADGRGEGVCALVVDAADPARLAAAARARGGGELRVCGVQIRW